MSSLNPNQEVDVNQKLIVSAIAAVALLGAGVAYAQQNILKPNEGPGAAPPVAAPTASAPSTSDVLAKPAPVAKPAPSLEPPVPPAAGAKPAAATIDVSDIKKAVEDLKQQLEDMRRTVAAIDLRPLVIRIEKIEAASAPARPPADIGSFEKEIAALRDDIAALRAKEKAAPPAPKLASPAEAPKPEAAPVPAAKPPVAAAAPEEVLPPVPPKKPLVIGIDTNDDNLPAGWTVVR